MFHRYTEVCGNIAIIRQCWTHGVCRLVMSLGVNWVSLSYSWTTVYSNSSVFLGAGAVNMSDL